MDLYFDGFKKCWFNRSYVEMLVQYVICLNAKGKIIHKSSFMGPRIVVQQMMFKVTQFSINSFTMILDPLKMCLQDSYDNILPSNSSETSLPPSRIM